MEKTYVQNNFLKALNSVASKQPEDEGLQTAVKNVNKQCSKENLSKTIRSVDQKYLQEIFIMCMADEGNEDEVTSVDAGSSSKSRSQMSQSTFVTGSGGNKPFMSRTQVTSGGKSKDRMPSSTSDTSNSQHSVDVDDLKKKFPSFEWQNILKTLKKHLEDTDKSLQGNEEPSKTVTSSQKAAGETSKAARKEQDETKVALQKKMRDSQGPVWNSYLERLAEHLKSRDTVVIELEKELEDFSKRCQAERQLLLDENKKAKTDLKDAIERANNIDRKAKTDLKDVNERANYIERAHNNLLQDHSALKTDKEKVDAVHAQLKLSMQKDIDKLKQEKNSLQVDKNALLTDVVNLKSCLQQEQDKSKRNIESLKEALESERKSLNQKLTEMEKEKNDLRDRFSKVAGQKLAEKNPDIADLSDPNRAMKLSEKFSQIYDDDWTDAFQALGDRKMKSKEAIQLLMNILKDCYDKCEVVAAHQLEELKFPLIQPVKTVVEAPKGHAGMKGKLRLSSKHEKILKDARRQMWDASVDIVKQMILEQLKEWLKKAGPKAFDDTKEYIEKCAETCWLMVIHEPPIYMKMDTKQGEKLDANLYTPYSVSGEKIDYLVWPPLFNGKDGGLLSKGVAEPLKTIKRDQK